MEDLLKQMTLKERGTIVPYGGKPKFVKLAPNDTGEHLPAVFFEDPRTFKPEPGPLGQVHAWGLFPYESQEEGDLKAADLPKDAANLPSFDGITQMYRTMTHQMTYWGPDEVSPENQFMEVLKEKKRRQLAKLDLNGLDKRDVIIKIVHLITRDKDENPLIWRRFRVSAGIKLSVLQDKVISPIMGWVRNLHCYTFTDFRDGALFGPEHMNSVDAMAHIAQVGYSYLPDDRYMLAHIFSKEGDKFGYLYDFGDKWNHELEIEKILSPEDSDGVIRIIDGKGMCPGENMHGSHNYHEFLEEYKAADYAEKANKKREILNTPNYSDFGKPPALFDPFAFDLPAAERRLAEALASPNSVRSGAKRFNMPVAPGAEAFLDGMDLGGLKKGQGIEKTYRPDIGGYWGETTSMVRDRRNEAVCAQCGKPGGKELKTCSGCKQVLYCSPKHQKLHWKAWHKDQCSRKYLDKK